MGYSHLMTCSPTLYILQQQQQRITKLIWKKELEGGKTGPARARLALRENNKFRNPHHSHFDDYSWKFHKGFSTQQSSPFFFIYIDISWGPVLCAGN